MPRQPRSQRKPFARTRVASADTGLSVLDFDGTLVVDSSAAPRLVTIPSGLLERLTAGAQLKISAPAGGANPVSFVFENANDTVNGATPAAIAPLTTNNANFYLVKARSGDGSFISWLTCFRSTGDASASQGALFQAELAGAPQVVGPVSAAPVLFNSVLQSDPGYSYNAATGVLTFNLAGKYQWSAGILAQSSAFLTPALVDALVRTPPAAFAPLAAQDSDVVLGFVPEGLTLTGNYEAAGGDEIVVNFTNSTGAQFGIFPRSSLSVVKVG